MNKDYVCGDPRQSEGMKSDFGGAVAELYARYRRDLPQDQAAALAERMGLQQDDVLLDLGCGTGQLGVPLRTWCGMVIGVDPEPAMLVKLRERKVDGVLCVLGTDQDLPTIRSTLAKPVGGIVIGNALHWMDEEAALQVASVLLRPGGAVAVVTQGPPMWLGLARWQQRVGKVLSTMLGGSGNTCGSDTAALERCAEVLRRLGLHVQVATWQTDHHVNTEWVLGHLGSALPENILDDDQLGLSGMLRDVLAEEQRAEGGLPLIERVTTTALIGRAKQSPSSR